MKVEELAKELGVLRERVEVLTEQLEGHRQKHDDFRTEVLHVHERLERRTTALETPPEPVAEPESPTPALTQYPEKQDDVTP